ncbi:MAG TPA: hypothetical protein VGI75_09095, partial [Pirellulales bacterium]
EQARKLHSGSCANCSGPGPVDVHTSHWVFSALIFTRWRSSSLVCCQACGSKAKWKALLSSAATGWWGFPWGLVVTPVQIIRNVNELIRAPNPAKPSAKMVNLVRSQLANQLLQESKKVA